MLTKHYQVKQRTQVTNVLVQHDHTQYTSFLSVLDKLPRQNDVIVQCFNKEMTNRVVEFPHPIITMEPSKFILLLNDPSQILRQLFKRYYP